MAKHSVSNSQELENILSSLYYPTSYHNLYILSISIYVSLFNNKKKKKDAHFHNKDGKLDLLHRRNVASNYKKIYIYIYLSIDIALGLAEKRHRTGDPLANSDEHVAADVQVVPTAPERS